MGVVLSLQHKFHVYSMLLLSSYRRHHVKDNLLAPTRNYDIDKHKILGSNLPS